MPELGVLIKVHSHFEGLSLPEYKTCGSSGMDLLAACTDPVVFRPGDRYLIPTGLSVAIPEDYEAQIRPRSGLAIQYGIGLPNSPGTIDSDYRGEIKVILINYGREDFTVTRGMRIAQMVIAPVVKARLLVVDNLDETHRASGGFGHTGLQH